MSSAAPPPLPPSPVTSDPHPAVEARSDSARVFWQILTHYDSTKVSPHRAFRNAIGVVLPLIVGFALQMPRGGLVVATGALNVSYSDGSDPYYIRARRMLASTFVCSVAVFAGAMSGSHQLFAIVLASAWAFVAGMLVAVAGAAPDIGLISLVILLVYSAQPLTPHQAAVSGILALAGGLLQTALSVALWPVRRYDPERRALATFYQELAARAAAPLVPTSAPMASAASEQAQQSLLGLGRDSGPDSMRYRALLNQGERMRLSVLMLLRLRLRMERERRDYPGIEILNDYLHLASEILREISSLLSSTAPAPAPPKKHQAIEQLARIAAELRHHALFTPPSFIAAVAKDAVFQMDALGGQLRASLDLAQNQVAVGRLDAAEPLTPHTWKEAARAWMETLRENLNLQSFACRHALRLAVLVALGDLMGRVVSWRRTYWLPMTIVLVLKPDFTATFSRGLLRIAGTIVGLLLATGLFHLFHPGAESQVILIFLFVYLLRWVGPANYGIFGIMVSALIVLLLAINSVAPKDVVWARGINTSVGGALALLAYWLWPSWERTRVSERIAQLLEAYCKYLHHLTHVRVGENSSLESLERSRRDARVARSNLEASMDRLSSEPGSTRQRMSRLNAVLASSHRFIHAAMALDAILLQTPELADSPALEVFGSSVEKTLTMLAATLRGNRVAHKDFPDLREEHRLMVQARTPGANIPAARFDSLNIETDRIVNSVNTLVEQILEWSRSPEFENSKSVSTATEAPTA